MQTMFQSGHSVQKQIGATFAVLGLYFPWVVFPLVSHSKKLSQLFSTAGGIGPQQNLEKTERGLE